MKILHIIPTYRPAFNRGGPIVSVHNLNKWLARKGVDVTVYTTDIDTNGKTPLAYEKNGFVENGIELDGVKIFYFRASFPKIWEYWRVGILPAFLPRHWEYSRDLHKALQQNIAKFDLIHITSTFLFASILGAYYAKKYKKPYIISLRGNIMEPLELKGAIKKKLYIHLIEKKALQNAIIHCSVPAEREHYERYKLLYKDFIIIPNGIDPDELNVSLSQDDHINFQKKYNINPDDKIALFLGRLNWKKGLDTLISAFVEVIKKEPRALLLLAGADEKGYQSKVEAWIKKHHIGNRVRFTGELLGKDKISALTESNTFVLPSYSENFGMAVVEAMYCGLPVVITSNVGIAPYIEKAKAGFVVLKEPKDVARAILRLFRNPNEQKDMGMNGKQLVEREFVMSQIIDQWITTYQELITNN